LKGCRYWQRKGLAPPSVITSATDAYKREMDLLGQWLNECCNEGQTLSVAAREAYGCYKSWAFQNGYKPWTEAAFGRKVAERFKRRRTAKGNSYDGFELKADI